MIAYVSCLCPVHESVSCGSSANNIELNNQKYFIYQRQWRTITNDGEFEMPPSHGENRGSSPLGSAKSLQTHAAARHGRDDVAKEKRRPASQMFQNMDRSEQPPLP